MEKEIEIIRKIRFDFFHIGNPLGLSEARRESCNQTLQKVLKVMQATKPSQRRIGETEYQCTHKDKNEINGDCVWCALSVAETGLKKQREIRLELEKAVEKAEVPEEIDKLYPHDPIVLDRGKSEAILITETRNRIIDAYKPIIAKRDLTIATLKEELQLKFGMWLCPQCNTGAPSGKICRDCLEKELADLKARLGEIGNFLRSILPTCIWNKGLHPRKECGYIDINYLAKAISQYVLEGI